jgi:hypothetical protein
MTPMPIGDVMKLLQWVPPQRDHYEETTTITYTPECRVCRDDSFTFQATDQQKAWKNSSVDQ